MRDGDQTFYDVVNIVDDTILKIKEINNYTQLNPSKTKLKLLELLSKLVKICVQVSMQTEHTYECYLFETELSNKTFNGHAATCLP